MVRKLNLYFLLPAVAIILLLYVWQHLKIHYTLVLGGALESSRIVDDTLIDPIGLTHKLTHPATRIVSVNLGVDEILSGLVKPEQVVGVTQWADDAGVSNVAGFYPDNIVRIKGDVESILMLEPDLVFVASHTNAETVRLLMSSGIPVVRINQLSSMDNVAENIRLAALATNQEEKAEAIIKTMQSRIKAVQQQIKNIDRPRVLYYGVGGYTSGVGGLMDEIIQLSGGQNVVRELNITGNTNLTEELAISLQPDVIIMSGWTIGNAASELDLRNKVAWQDVPAVKNNRVYPIEGTWILSTSHYRVAGVEAVARLLHPEAFTE